MLKTLLLARFFYSEKNENVDIYINEIYVSQDGFQYRDVWFRFLAPANVLYL